MASRSTIVSPQLGHLGEGSAVDAVGADASGLVRIGLLSGSEEGLAVLTECTNSQSSGLATKASGFPSANDRASRVNDPQVTRMPRVADSLVMTPKSSRTGFTPTLLVLHRLHWTRTCSSALLIDRSIPPSPAALPVSLTPYPCRRYASPRRCSNSCHDRSRMLLSPDCASSKCRRHHFRNSASSHTNRTRLATGNAIPRATPPMTELMSGF